MALGGSGGAPSASSNENSGSLLREAGYILLVRWTTGKLLACASLDRDLGASGGVEGFLTGQSNGV